MTWLRGTALAWVDPSALQENDKDKGNTGEENFWTFCTVGFNMIQSGLGTRIALAWSCEKPDTDWGLRFDPGTFSGFLDMVPIVVCGSCVKLPNITNKRLCCGR